MLGLLCLALLCAFGVEAQPNRNRCLQPPCGPVIKPMPSTAGLELTTLAPTSTVPTTGSGLATRPTVSVTTQQILESTTLYIPTRKAPKVVIVTTVSYPKTTGSLTEATTENGAEEEVVTEAWQAVVNGRAGFWAGVSAGVTSVVSLVAFLVYVCVSRSLRVNVRAGNSVFHVGLEDLSAVELQCVADAVEEPDNEDLLFNARGISLTVVAPPHRKVV